MSKSIVGRAAAGACVIALSAATLAGCAASDSDRAVLEKLDALEAEIGELKGDQAQSGDAGSADEAAGDAKTDASSASGGSASASDGALAQELTESYPELADFEQRTAELEAACESAQAGATRDETYQAFLDVKYQLDQLERDMDAYDDEREHAAKTGGLAYEEYMKIERAIDRLDDRLDYAKDGMEMRLGIDD